MRRYRRYIPTAPIDSADQVVNLAKHEQLAHLAPLKITTGKGPQSRPLLMRDQVQIRRLGCCSPAFPSALA
jgi:hypothetical protein